MQMPQAVHFETGAAVRVDAGVRAGDTISPFYDPMVAKLIVWGKDREQALSRMAQALAEYQVVGVATNIAFLGRLINSTAFSTADLDTGLIERNQATLFPPAELPSAAALALAAAALLQSERTAASSDPWAQTSGWRMNGQLERTLSFSNDAGSVAVQLVYQPDGWQLRFDAQSLPLNDIRQQAAAFSLRLNGKAVLGSVVREQELFHVFHGGQHWQLQWRDPIAHAGEAEAEGGRLTAPMPGKIVALLVAAGAQVEQGAPLLIMEAMKMEHTINAPANGTVAELLYAVGDQVAEGAQLLSFQIAEAV
jgi:3-methylcrotonyl-CoA carboxylase alpha subunit